MMEWDPNSLSPPDSFEPRFTCQMGIITEPALLSFVNDIMRKYPAWNLEQNRDLRNFTKLSFSCPSARSPWRIKTGRHPGEGMRGQGECGWS